MSPSRRQLLIAGLLTPGALALTAGLTRVGRAAPARQMGPGQPINQLTGDAFDQAFLTMMVAHHALAIPMARPVGANATHPELKDLANGIIATQTNEIGQMRDWAKSWYNLDLPDPLTAPPMAGIGAGSMPGMGGSSMPGMPGMTPANVPATPVSMAGMSMPGQAMGGMDMMADMWTLAPNRLEAVFMTMMIPHHQGAIDMAKFAPDHALHQELKDLAGRITSSQTAEIDQLNRWLAAWYNL